MNLNLIIENKIIEAKPLVIRTQYGDDSIALVQWAYEKKLPNVQVVYADTGFAAESWEERIKLGEAHANRCGFLTTRIISPISFPDAIKGRGEFPSSKFQWCSTLLKGLPFLDWLDTWDIHCNAIIMIAKRKEAASAHGSLSEWIEKCEFHNHRTVWHAILEVNDKERDALLTRAGFKPLNHRSLECEPCVNSTPEDLARLHPMDCEKIDRLEQALSASLFSEEIRLTVKQAKAMSQPKTDKDNKNKGNKSQENKNNENKENKENKKEKKPQYLDLFYRGCGNPFGCGL